MTGSLIPVILYATFNNTPAMVNSAATFKLTTTNPCTTSSMTVTTIAAVTVSMLSTATSDVKVKDSASTSYGAKDGFTLCGSRTYTQTYTYGGVAIANPSWIT